jgi:four helix bundle protein
LHAYQKALELLAAIRGAQIRDAKLRDEALRAAKGTCLNIAEGAGRVTRADKARAYAIARGECVEAVAATEIAAASGDAVPEAAARAVALGNQLYLTCSSRIRCRDNTSTPWQ